MDRTSEPSAPDPSPAEAPLAVPRSATRAALALVAGACAALLAHAPARSWGQQRGAALSPPATRDERQREALAAHHLAAPTGGPAILQRQPSASTGAEAQVLARLWRSWRARLADLERRAGRGVLTDDDLASAAVVWPTDSRAGERAGARAHAPVPERVVSFALALPRCLVDTGGRLPGAISVAAVEGTPEVDDAALCLASSLAAVGRWHDAESAYRGVISRGSGARGLRDATVQGAIVGLAELYRRGGAPRRSAACQAFIESP